jgi:hypothetical protein
MTLVISNRCGHLCLAGSTEPEAEKLADERIEGNSVCCRCLCVFKEDWCRMCLIAERIGTGTTYGGNFIEALDWVRTELDKRKSKGGS